MTATNTTPRGAPGGTPGGTQGGTFAENVGQVKTWVKEGVSDAEIAQRLGLTEQSVRQLRSVHRIRRNRRRPPVRNIGPIGEDNTMSTTQAALKWGYAPKNGYFHVTELCRAGRVPGAEKDAQGRWRIPANLNASDIEPPNAERHALRWQQRKG